MKKFLTSEVPMWRALLGLAVGVTYTAVGMFFVGKQALEIQAAGLRR